MHYSLTIYRGVKIRAEKMIALDDQDLSSSDDECGYTNSSIEEEVHELY